MMQLEETVVIMVVMVVVSTFLSKIKNLNFQIGEELSKDNLEFPANEVCKPNS